uniref:Chemokine interleukin-8-like domain-containing protein n=1 Tax=Monopterus albus TaxID=43700 RepID=A0A3Q3J2A2_MONAL|nr:C-C motif chemokine 20-like [Monopterus albus]
MHLQIPSPPHTNTFTLLKRLAAAADLSSDLQRNRDMASRVAALLLLGIICTGFAAAEIVLDCCLDTTKKFLPRHILVGYSIQEAGKGCDISATAFITRAGKKLCVVHPSKGEWVQRHITFLDNKKRAQQQ